MVVRFISLALFFVLFSQTSFAIVFKNLRNDQYVPPHCKLTKPEFFNVNMLEVFTISIRGAVERGFTFEYPMSRENAAFLFRSFKNGDIYTKKFMDKVNRNFELKRDFKIIQDQHNYRGFHFQSEGEVLEILALTTIQSNLDALNSNLFVTGSVEYYGDRSHAPKGELDVLIADKTNCLAIGYGEVKLGLRSRSKASRQVRRFSENLIYSGFTRGVSSPSFNYMQ